MGAFIAAGGEDVVDGPAFGAPLGDGAGGAEVDVVGVGHDGHEGHGAVVAEGREAFDVAVVAAAEGRGGAAEEGGEEGRKKKGRKEED